MWVWTVAFAAAAAAVAAVSFSCSSSSSMTTKVTPAKRAHCCTDDRDMLVRDRSNSVKEPNRRGGGR